MSTLGISRMSQPKSVDLPMSDYNGMCATSKFVEGRHPDFAAKVLVINDSEFTYTGGIPIDFDHLNPHAIRAQLRICFVDRWFPSECDLPCILHVYKYGELVYKLDFIVHHRITSRFPRNDFQLKTSPQEWSELNYARSPAKAHSRPLMAAAH